ncbi:MAG TPA: hypothetical protein VG501_07625 [Rhizomicrobium sp.]|nr:hypothetical protein [Rhizomicrobium sp.]
MKLEAAIVSGVVLIGALLIAASILFIERYQISAMGYGWSGGGEGGSDTSEEKVFRLDRWTGEIEYCAIGGGDPQDFSDQALKTGHAVFRCGFPKAEPAPARDMAP